MFSCCPRSESGWIGPLPYMAFLWLINGGVLTTYDGWDPILQVFNPLASLSWKNPPKPSVRPRHFGCFPIATREVVKSWNLFELNLHTRNESGESRNPLKNRHFGYPKKGISSEPSIFRGVFAVSFREGTALRISDWIQKWWGE